jgi:hypothetical protein
MLIDLNSRLPSQVKLKQIIEVISINMHLHCVATVEECVKVEFVIDG